MSEREPQPTISELITRQQQLTTRLEKQRDLLSTIPDRIAKLDPWTQTQKLIRRGKAQIWLERSLERGNSRLASIAEQISQRGEESKQQAHTFRTELAQRRAQLAQMEGLPTIPSQVLDTFRQRLVDFEQSPQANPTLKFGLELLQAGEETQKAQPPAEAPTPEEEEEKPAKIALVDPAKKRFVIDGKIVTFKQSINWSLLVLIARINNPDRTYTPAELKKIALAFGAADVPGVGSQAFNNLKNSIANSVSGARSDFFERTEEGKTKYKINATFEGFEKISIRTIEQLLRELGVTKKFGAEPVSEVVFNLLNDMVNNPGLTVEQAIELRGRRSDNRPFNTSQLLMSLNSAVNVLIVRSREGTLTEQEKALVELICSKFEQAEVNLSLKSFRKNILHWIKEGAPLIIPTQEPGGPSRKGVREKITVQMPDGTELETHGKQGKGLQYLVVLAANEGSFSVRSFAKDIYASDTSPSLQAAKSLLRQITKLPIKSGWEVDIPQDLKDVDKILTVSVVKTPEQPSAHAQEIALLHKNLQELVEQRESFQEAVDLSLPGPYSQELEGINEEIKRKQAEIDQLKQN